MTLTELAIKWKCDKYYSHSYLPAYESLLGNRDVKRLLEIGIGYAGLMKDFVPEYIHGASLRMWSEYWPEALIVGADIRTEVLFQEGNIHTFQLDQSKPQELWNLVNYFTGCRQDVIVDDGSHMPEHQILTALILMPILTDGGLYVIEDCREPDRIVQALGCGEIHSFHKRADDCLVVIRR